MSRLGHEGGAPAVGLVSCVLEEENELQAPFWHQRRQEKDQGCLRALQGLQPPGLQGAHVPDGLLLPLGPRSPAGRGPAGECTQARQHSPTLRHLPALSSASILTASLSPGRWAIWRTRLHWG